ncbi:hypothetical protein, partial [Salinimonas chungwhensis]|uniref:hypothetical protein n=1 Tax=Salinimonas chungwhensis TaxID=265425 RepID=UPI00058D38DC
GKHRMFLSDIRMKRAHIPETKLWFQRMRVTIVCLKQTSITLAINDRYSLMPDCYTSNQNGLA